MQTNNVYYAEQPQRVVVTSRGDKAVVEFPIGVSKEATEEGEQWKADKVFSLETRNRDHLAEVVESNYDAWLEKAQQIEPQTASLSDVVDALNALTDLILGGM